MTAFAGLIVALVYLFLGAIVIEEFLCVDSDDVFFGIIGWPIIVIICVIFNKDDIFIKRKENK